jgi:hypothetical protein
MVDSEIIKFEAHSIQFLPCDDNLRQSAQFLALAP